MLGIGPILAGIALTIVAAIILFGEFITKAVGIGAQVVWNSIRPHRRAAHGHS